MKFDVIIPTRGSIPQLKSILSCIGNQTLQPKTIILVVNGISDTEEEWKKHFATFMPPELQLGVEVVFIPHTSSYANNASCARNIGIQNATSPYVYLLDDDNIF
ncbi:MAG: glycosyltransferase family A protein [bacterium]